MVALATPVAPILGQDSGAQACAPSSGYTGRVAKFQAMPLSKQLKKIEFWQGGLLTPGIGLKRLFGLVDEKMQPRLEYRLSDKGPQYRLKLTEHVPGSTSVNFHYAYTVAVLIDGEYVSLTKHSEDPAFGVCNYAVGGCRTEMRSYYTIDPQVFAQVERLPQAAILPLRIQREGTAYRPCQDFITAAEFRLLRSAIDRGLIP